MPCVEKSCLRPVLRAGRCVVHLREFENTVSINIAAPDPEIENGKPGHSPKKPYSRKFMEPLLPPPPPTHTKKLTTGRSLELAQHRQVAEHAPPWSYVGQEELEAHRQYAPRWKWLYEALEALPKGKVGLQIECPKNIDIARFRNMAGTAIRQAKYMDKWSIRKSIDGEHIVISKVGTWKEYDKEQNAKAAKAKS